MASQYQIDGFCAPEFLAVRNAFEENFKNCLEHSSSVSVYHKGTCVVDLWGSIDGSWKRDTITCVFSCTKALIAYAVWMLAERGQLDLEKPVAHYWPEFAANGKSQITVAHLMNHRAGLPSLRHQSELSKHAFRKWDEMVKALENEEPQWSLGSGRHAYHAITFGWLGGELVRRITGKTLGEFFRDEIATPFNIDFVLGVRKEEDHDRIIDTLPADINWPPEIQDLFVSLIPEELDQNLLEYRESEIPASNGHSNGRGLARLYAITANGGSLDGKRLLKKRTIDNYNIIGAVGPDSILGVPHGENTSFGLGFMKFGFPTRHCFGHAGQGGSLGFADPFNNVAFGYAQNQFVVPDDMLWAPAEHPKGDKRIKNLTDALYKCLKLKQSNL